MEGEAERERLADRRRRERSGDPERTGETLINLRIGDVRPGLAGRSLVDLAKPLGQRLPDNRLRVGSPVVFTDELRAAAPPLPGVVSRRTSDGIQVALDHPPEAKQVRLDLSPDERTRLRQLQAMARARLAAGRDATLRDVLLGEREPRFDPLPEINFATTLNDPQQDAVRLGIAARDVAIIHGPPGTGKTTTLAELVFQAVRNGERVLACGPSNTSVDNLLERLVELMPGVIRVGHPARVFESLRGHTLDELVENDPMSAIARRMFAEAERIVAKAKKRTRSRESGRRRGELFANARDLRQQARRLERDIVRQVLNGADVVCTTLTFDEDLLAGSRFDLVVIDEACQSTEPALWQAALRGDRVVLAGDHRQLPPTVLSTEAAREGLAISPMERLADKLEPATTQQLTVQYRMNEQIMKLPSQQFYDGSLIAHDSVIAHTLADLPAVAETDADDPMPVVEFWDTAGAEWDEELEPDGESKQNPREAVWVVDQVARLTAAGVRPEQIGVIAPYAAQVRLLRNRLRIDGLDVDTVDGFQGREKEAIIVCMVRSNRTGEIGFLADTRRTNVALTRARRALRIVGDSATLSCHPFYAAMVEHFQQTGAYRSVWEWSATPNP
ncbi:MAG: AAA domain-containing protein [Planctomycetota bacterium]